MRSFSAPVGRDQAGLRGHRCVASRKGVSLYWVWASVGFAVGGGRLRPVVVGRRGMGLRRGGEGRFVRRGSPGGPCMRRNGAEENRCALIAAGWRRWSTGDLTAVCGKAVIGGDYPQYPQAPVYACSGRTSCCVAAGRQVRQLAAGGRVRQFAGLTGGEPACILRRPFGRGCAAAARDHGATVRCGCGRGAWERPVITAM